MTLKEKLKKIIITEPNLEAYTPEDIRDDAPLFGDELGLDSIDAIEIIFQVKKHFGVAIRDMKEGRPALQCINTLAAFIEKRRSQ
jgi:acyl carrier protein